ncbi:MAG: hypothetical protein ACLRZH_05750 [Ruthenibacterium lactatiformans]
MRHAHRGRGPVVKTASGSAGIFPAPPRCWADGRFIGKVGRDSPSRMVAGTLRGQVDLPVHRLDEEMGLAFLNICRKGGIISITVKIQWAACCVGVS